MKLLFQIIRPAIIALALFMVSTTVTSRIANAAEVNPPPTVEAQDKSLLDLYSDGGWTMHFIALISVGTITIITYCATRIRSKKLIPPALERSLELAMSQQDVSAALQVCEGDSSSLSHVMKETLTKAGAGVEVYSKADLEAVAAETIFHEETKFMLWVNMLNAFAAVAPMLGLLGTVSGMIGSFNQLAAGASKPSDFAGGIGEAMITTAFALIVAIPSMLAYFVFKNLLQSIVGDLAYSASNLINRFISGSGVGASSDEA
ncbi:MotA/TolQ/ExbB proton channel family protein [Luteolibacter pohnpeiensis]|uniref:MotA/TolQ/ExbB proton channel family protein n=1 Tax=Luteolibacter pohnpeiensis TaxID=454153 RepID=A0A934S6F5_9BACT|nr:MotA/TolQ/ExbB proton channel family protein [Luteolibacter pohnpeiensis]MBK1883960.1 MotA/TolQ/ExbB proton channel family protein [Luteolibacter pohnpeiensis]